MKKLLTLPLFLLLLHVVSLPVRGQNARAMGAAPAPARNLRLTMELKDLPGGNASGSLWEVSYQFRIADRREFNEWALGGKQAGQGPPGLLLLKDSFRRDRLSEASERRIEASVPIQGELRERMTNAAQRQQIVWLEATVRIRDGNAGPDVVKTLSPVWGPHFYLAGDANLRMELTPRGSIRWSTSDVSPWEKEKRDEATRVRVASAP